MLKTVLVVEDYEPLRELATQILHQGGYRPIAVGCGEDALRAAPLEKPDLITLDIGLPGIDGWETLRRLKSAPETATIPVVIVTAMSSAQDIAKGYSLGAAHYIVKPYRLDGLVRAVEAVLSGDQATLPQPDSEPEGP